MEFSSREQFELHVHKCFGKIFDTLMKMDSLIKMNAEREEESGKYGPMCDLRDQIEEVILHSHLAWQYHRLARSLDRATSTWDVLEAAGSREKESPQDNPGKREAQAAD